MNSTFISPLYDFVFTLLFGDQRNIAITRAFLKTVLDIPDEEYGELTVVNPFLKRLFRKGKAGIVDIRLVTRSGRIIHIEIQVEKIAAMRNRILYYSSKLLAEQLKQGDEYEELRQVVSIVICDHVLLEEEESYLNVYELQNLESRRFTDLLKVIILELPKVPEREDRPVWAWARFLRCQDMKECEMLAAKHPEIGEAVFTVKKLSWGEERRMIREQLSLWKSDERIMKKEARAVGHAEGYEQARLEMARKMNALGDSAERIEAVTGLSREAVKALGSAG